MAVVAAFVAAAAVHEHGLEISGEKVLVVVPRDLPWLLEPSFLGPLRIVEVADQAEQERIQFTKILAR